jgi:hypothetical protein
MHADTTRKELPDPVVSERDMLDKVRRDLVGIHAAIAERAGQGNEIMPWTLRELMTLIREIRTFQKEHSANGALEEAPKKVANPG